MRKWRRDLASASPHPVPDVQYASILSGVLGYMINYCTVCLSCFRPILGLLRLLYNVGLLYYKCRRLQYSIYTSE